MNNTAVNLDTYIKSENSIYIALSTKLDNSIQITINSSLPYQLNSYLLTEIKNANNSNKIDINRLNIKDNTNQIEVDYKDFFKRFL